MIMMNRKKYVFILMVVVSFLNAQIFAFSQQDNRTFRAVKKQAKIIWQDHRISFYCDCTYDAQLTVSHSSCGYQPQDMKRANRIEWEHLVPVSWFGHQRPCWKQAICQSKKGKPYSGRNCCEKVDDEFRMMYTDLHNLVPVIGEVNKARQYFRFAEMPDNLSNYNGCEIKISEALKKVEPKTRLKGMIARAYLYMQKTYDFKLNKQQNKLFHRWNQKNPPDEWEQTWNQRIMDIQGTDNTFISAFEY